MKGFMSNYIQTQKGYTSCYSTTKRTVRHRFLGMMGQLVRWFSMNLQTMRMV